MNRKMLINAQRTEEVRIAVVTDGTLDRFEVAETTSGLVRGNIYRGVVSSVQQSLNAAFVDIGLERHGMLRADDVIPEAHHRKSDGQRRQRIDRILEKGQTIMVQVARDGVGAKGTLLTTNISLAGRYMVMMPYDDVRGVSRKAEDEEIRKKLKERISQMTLPEGFGVIARTNAIDQPKTALNRDANALLRLWKKIRREFSTGKGIRFLYSDQDLIVQALRDFLDSSIQEVLVDDDQAFAKVKGYMQSFMPRARTKVVHYEDRMPLFSHFSLEVQIDRIYQRKVELPCGGSIVIDATEALTAIDVNSGRTRGASQEENNRKINLEASLEVARQLRLRDIGGLIVVDFIDMRANKNQRDVEKALREAMREDKARFTVGRISPNGLLEINRQRMKKALRLRTYRTCPTCSGSGTIASPELVGLNLLRRIETRAVTGRLQGVKIALHPELADALQNERRQELAELEREFDLRIEIIAATSLHRADEKIEWFHRDVEKAPEKPQSAALSAADLAQEVQGRSMNLRRPAKNRDETEGAEKSEKSKQSETSESNETTRTEKTTRRRRRGGRRRRRPTPKVDGDSSQSDQNFGNASRQAGPKADVSSPAEAKEGASQSEVEPKRHPWWRRKKKEEE